MLHLIGIILSLFLSAVLFSKKGKSQADLVLAFWLLAIGIHLAIFYIHISGNYAEFPYMLGVEIPLPLIHAPMLYLYTANLTGQHINGIKWYFHLLPLIIAFCLLHKFFLFSFEEKMRVYINDGAGFNDAMTWIYIAIIVSGVAYLSLSFFLLRRYRKHITDQCFALEKINLNWLNYLVIGNGIVWLAVIFGNDITIFTSIDLFVMFIGYFGIKQVGVFTNSHIDIKPVGIENLNLNYTVSEDFEEVISQKIEKVKYSRSKVDGNLLIQLHQDLIWLMQTEKLYRNPDLTLIDLARQLSVNANTLSQVINSIEKKNFYDYINLQRVNEFKQLVLLPKNKKFTLLFLAFEVGFNSKTSFNRNFKRITGQAPTAYLQQQNIKLNGAETTGYID